MHAGEIAPSSRESARCNEGGERGWDRGGSRSWRVEVARTTSLNLRQLSLGRRVSHSPWRRNTATVTPSTRASRRPDRQRTTLSTRALTARRSSKARREPTRSISPKALDHARADRAAEPAHAAASGAGRRDPAARMPVLQYTHARDASCSMRLRLLHLGDELSCLIGTLGPPAATTTHVRLEDSAPCFEAPRSLLSTAGG